MLLQDIIPIPLENLYIDRDKIHIIDYVKIDSRLYARFDLICKKYYNNELDILPLFYMFNQISNPVELFIDQILEIPEMNSLLENTFTISLDENNIPGVVKYTNNSRYNSEIKLSKKNTTKTTALPKLDITTDKIVYDEKKGLLIL
jgi:hypothetical protein